MGEFSQSLPTSMYSPVNVNKLNSFVEECWAVWTDSEKNTAKKALQKVKGEALVKLSKELPGLNEKNAVLATENGAQMTDTLAEWIRKGFVAGPFDEPPLKKFCSNPLMAVVQKTNVRPILNLSSPKGASFNDAAESVDKFKMCSAKMFAETLIKAGKSTVIAKPDIRDAYKLIPNPVSKWRFYGFSWLGKKFYDSTTVFGSAAAPASFDPLPERIVNITCTKTGTPRKWVKRQLDDVPIVSPMGQYSPKNFTRHTKLSAK